MSVCCGPLASGLLREPVRLVFFLLKHHCEGEVCVVISCISGGRGREGVVVAFVAFVADGLWDGFPAVVGVKEGLDLLVRLALLALLALLLLRLLLLLLLLRATDRAEVSREEGIALAGHVRHGFPDDFFVRCEAGVGDKAVEGIGVACTDHSHEVVIAEEDCNIAGFEAGADRV